MNAMADALMKAGLVTEERATRVLQDKAIDEEMNSGKVISMQERLLKKELKKLIDDAENNRIDRSDAQQRLDELASEYDEVFDKVTTEAAFAYNLRTLKN